MVSTSLNLETISLNEVKAFVRVDTDAHDALLTVLMNAAMHECFNLTHTCFGTGEITVKRWDVLQQLDLPYGPVNSITSVKLDGETTDSANYELRGNLLQIDVAYSESIEVVYAIGTTMPADVKHAILQRIKYGFDFGDDLPQNQQPRFFDRVLMRYRDHKTFAG